MKNKKYNKICSLLVAFALMLTFSGCRQKFEIEIEKAKEIALNNANIKKENAVFKIAKLDSDDLIPHFDIEFYADGYEYEYEINANTGEILAKDKEKE